MMAGNYLEQLVAEWYEYNGYFVRQNVWVGKRPNGGYECEVDIVAFHPRNKHLVHIEPSMDADSWPTREARYTKKFEAGRKYIPALFEGLDLPAKIEQQALLRYASKKNHTMLGGGQIVLVPELLERIFQAMLDKPMESQAVSENLPILRSFQLVSDYKDVVRAVWDEPKKP